MHTQSLFLQAYCILRKMCNNCARKFYAQYLRKLGLSFVNAQYLCKILSLMRNICARFAQDCTYFPIAQYMCKICTRLDLFPNAQYVRNICSRLYCFSNAQYMRKICTRLYFFSNAQYMRKICARLYFFLQCAIYVQDLHKVVLTSPVHNICTISQALLEEICHISHICSKFRMVCTS